MIIYKITNKINGKVYVGQTTVSLKKRWMDHCTNKKKMAIANAIRKYGKENFTIEEIDGANSLSELNYLEQHHIYMNDSLAPKGYNIDLGGNNSSPSYETRQKIGNAGKGRKRSEETRNKSRLAMLGNTHTLGHRHTDESKFKMKLSSTVKRIIIATNLTTGKIYNFESILDASEYTKIDSTIICKICRNYENRKKSKNWTFIYG